MADEVGSQSEGDLEPEVLLIARRDRWATPIALISIGIHWLLGVITLGWLYWIVPHTKLVLDQRGVQVSDVAILLIRQSDFCVNYWYMFLVLGPVFLAMDFLVTRWIVRQLGLIPAILFGLSIAGITCVGYFVLGMRVLNEALNAV